MGLRVSHYAQVSTMAQSVRPAEKSPEAFQARKVATISLTHWIHDTYTAFLPPLLPEFITKLDLSNTGAGTLSVFLQLPSLLQPLLGHLGDRRDLRWLIVLAPAVTAVTMSLLGIAPNYALLALLLATAGASSAAFHAVVPVLVGQLSGKRLGFSMGLWMVGGELGRAFGPLIVVSAVKWLGLAGTPWLMLAGLLATALVASRLRGLPVTAARRAESEQRPRLGWHGLQRLLFPLIGFMTIRAFVLAALTTYLPIYMIDTGADLWLAGVALTVLEVAGVVGAFLSGGLSDRLGRRRMLMGAVLCTSVLMFIFVYSAGWVQFPLLLAMGFFAISITPVVMALVQESAPENRALINGIYMALNFGIRSLIIIVVGMLGDWLGMRTTFLVSAGLALLAIPCAYWLPERRGVTG